MQFDSAKRRWTVRLTRDRNEKLYEHILQFYIIPPIDHITLQEFEDLALKRLQMLRIVEKIGLKHIKFSDEYRTALICELRKQKFHAYTKKNLYDKDLNEDYYEDCRKDHISHFILRLAYCRTEELRKWFLNQEVDLFRFRLGNEPSSSIHKFFKLNKIDYCPINKEEKESIIGFLKDSSYNFNLENIKAMEYFKVHFLDVLDLVSNRKTYLRNGFAYIPEVDLKTIIANIFRVKLSRALAATARSLPELEGDRRLLKMLKSLNQKYLGNDYNFKIQSSSKITTDMIDNFANTSFPLCMATLHETFRHNHHLRHGGRMQYGLFLKGIGLSLEDALQFWKKEFIKTIDSVQFDKQYAYSIRHNYGKEGKRANYTPYSCIKIITSNQPGLGDSHGCPFKHTDVSLLSQKLQNLGITQQQVQQIRDLIQKGHFQIACTQYFEITHKVSLDQAINHPNYYFEESQKIRSCSTLKDQSTKISTTKAHVYIKEELDITG